MWAYRPCDYQHNNHNLLYSVQRFNIDLRLSIQRPFFGLIQFSSPPIFLHIIGDKHLCSSNSKWKKDCKTKSLKERCYIISVGQQSRGNTHSEGRHAPGQRTLEQTDIWECEIASTCNHLYCQQTWSKLWEFKRSKSVFQFSRKKTCSRCSCALVNNRVAKVAWFCKQRSLESFDQDKNMKSRMNDGIWKECCSCGICWLSLISIIGTAGVLVLIKISNCLHVTSLEMVYLYSLLSFLSLSQKDHKTQLHLISDHPLYAW